ncbi:DUF1674 domain-containing protein [Acidisoma sp. C75]
MSSTASDPARPAPTPAPGPSPAPSPEPSPAPAPQDTPPVDPQGGLPREIGGPKGPEPTRFGDWEQKGRCTDF